MPLLGNYSVLLKSCGRFRSGSTVSDNRAAFNAPGAARGFFCGEARVDLRASIPDGYKPGKGAWVIPIRGGGLSSFAQAQASMSADLSMAAGRNIDGAAALTIDTPGAALQLIVSATGTATITLTGDALAVGALSGSGSVSFTFTASDALLGALAGITGTAPASLSADATITALGALAGDILPYTELSPESLAQAVLDAVAESGPDGDYTVAQLLRLIVSAVAGASSGGPGSPAFKAISDATQTRIAGTADSSGDRSAITYDPS